MGQATDPATNSDVRAFWEKNPVAAEGIDATPGTPGFLTLWVRGGKSEKF